MIFTFPPEKQEMITVNSQAQLKVQFSKDLQRNKKSFTGKRMVYPGFMKNKTNECHNKCYTGCHGDDISDQEGGHFYPETWVKMPAKISPLKGSKFSLILVQ